MNPRTTRATARLGASAVALAALSWVTTTGAVAATVCTPTTDRPTLDVEPGPVDPGATVRVTGAGWCNELDGGSRVAIKLDEGAYSHLTDALHPNRTIWALVDADPTNGTFEYDMVLPDGTTKTSQPAFAEGTHTLRALTGSLKEGDPVRTVRSTGEFVVGAHRPSGVPAPVDATELTAEGQRSVTASVKDSRLTLEVVDGQEGDWVFLSVLGADGSPRYPWRDAWHRLDARGRLQVGTGDDPVEGAQRLVVQNGNRGAVGEVVGWTKVDFGTGPAKKPTKKPTKGTKKSSKSTKKTKGTTKKPAVTPTPAATPTPTSVLPVPLPTVSATPAPELPKDAPKSGATPESAPEDEGPESPVRRWSGFWANDELPAEVKKGELVVQAGASEAVHVHVHDTTSSVAAGWVASDADGRIRLDVGDLPPGRYRFALQQGEGDYLGWAALEVPEDGEATTSGSKGAVGSLIAAARGGDDGGSTDGWLAGMGLVLLVGVGLGSAARRKATT